MIIQTFKQVTCIEKKYNVRFHTTLQFWHDSWPKATLYYIYRRILPVLWTVALPKSTPFLLFSPSHRSTVGLYPFVEMSCQ